MAGRLGAGYAHAHFFVPRGGEAATAVYRDAAAGAGRQSHTVLAVRAVTAPDSERAQALADAMVLWRARKDLGHDGPIPSAETAAQHLWSEAERTRAQARTQAIVAGTPEQVHAELHALARAHGAEEVMVNTLTSDPADRLTSYQLLADRFSLTENHKETEAAVPPRGGV